MASNSRMAMYEAQAIAIEKQLEIDKLKAEKDELAERVRVLELEREGKSSYSSDRKLDGVCAAVNEVKQQLFEIKNLQEEAQFEIACFIQTVEESSAKMWEAINSLQKRHIGHEDDIESSTSQNSQNKSPPIPMNSGHALPIKIPRTIDIKQPQRDTILTVAVNNDYPGTTSLAILSNDRSKWIPLTLKLQYGMRGSGVVYFKNEIYFLGGHSFPTRLFKLDKDLNWTRLADMNIGRGFITNSCLEWGGYIWVFGGMGIDCKPLKSVERYDPKTNQWTILKDMKTARSNAAVASFHNGIIISGGDIGPCFTADVEWYNNQWPPLLYNMPTRLYGHAAISYKNKLIVMGGYDENGANKSVWEVEPHKSRKWRPRLPMKNIGYQYSGIVLDKEIYAIGGGIDGVEEVGRVGIFDGEYWRNGPALPFSTSIVYSVLIPPNMITFLCNAK